MNFLIAFILFFAITFVLLRRISARNKRARMVAAARARTHDNSSFNQFAKVHKSIVAPIVFNTNTDGIEVNDNLTEEQATAIRKIFESVQITKSPKNEDF